MEKVNLEFETLFFVFHSQAVEEEDKMTPEQLAIKNVGKQVRCTVVIGWLCSRIITCPCIVKIILRPV